MSNARTAGIYGSAGTFLTGIGLVGLMETTAEVQTLVEAHLARASSINLGAVLDAYEFADKSRVANQQITHYTALIAGSLFLGAALYNLAQAYQRKE